MNKQLERIHKELSTPKMGDGRIPFHPILMMHCARMFGHTYTEFMTDYKVLVETNIKCLELYDHDAVSVISDPFRETSAFGAQISFHGDNSPSASVLVSNLDDVKRLKNPDVYQCTRTLDRINGVKYYRELLGQNFPIIGWVEGPLAESSDLMGITELLMNTMMEPDMVKMLAEKCLQTAKDFALAQIEAGSNIIGVGDAVCSLISEDLYDEFCLPLHQELFEFIHQHGALVKVHICGNTSHILPSLKKTGLDILDVDWMVDMGEAFRIMGDDTVLCGNLDPVSVIMDGNKELIKKKYDEVRASLPVENWILMGGCEIPVSTPKENMQYLREISMKA